MERENCARNLMNTALLVGFWVSGNTAADGRTINVSTTISIILWKDEPLQAEELRAKLLYFCLFLLLFTILVFVFVPFSLYHYPGVCICIFLESCNCIYICSIFCIVFVLQEDSGFRLHLDNGGRKWVWGSGGSGAGLWLPLGQDLMIISLMSNEMITNITTKMITKITLRPTEWSPR